MNPKVGKLFIASINYKSEIIQMFQNKQLPNSARQNLSTLGFGTEAAIRKKILTFQVLDISGTDILIKILHALYIQPCTVCSVLDYFSTIRSG